MVRNPLFRFRFGDGQEIEGSYSQLVGRREEGELAAPRMQHSYVITAHSSQGAAYARTVDLTLEGHGREATLVATTRHRIDHFKVVAIDRLSDKLEGKQAVTLAISAGGRLAKASEDDDERAAEKAHLESVKTAYFTECAGHDPFGNVSDFYADIYAFAGVDKPPSRRPAGLPAPMASPLRAMRMRAVAKSMRHSRDAERPAMAILPGERATKEKQVLAIRRTSLAWWDNLKWIGDKTNRWLVEARGISAEVIARLLQ